MIGFFKKHTGTFVVAFVVASVAAAAPVIAATVQNARHAHIADIAKNARRLGGIGSAGYYKLGETVANADHAADSDALGGLPASSYATTATAGLKAYVLVDNGGGTTPSPVIVGAKTYPSGWAVVKATKTGSADNTGVYCLTPPTNSGIDPAKATGVATVENSVSDPPGGAYLVYVDQKPTGNTGANTVNCGTGQFMVRTFALSGTNDVPPDVVVNADPSNNVAFNFLVT